MANHRRTTPRPHGTRAKYTVEKCQCDACREANRLYSGQLMREHLYGRYDRLVDAAPVTEHIRTLQAAGISLQRVAEIVGSGKKTPVQISLGRVKRCKKELAAAILAIPVDPVRLGDPGGKVPSVGAVRRLQALCATGYTLTELGSMLGMDVRDMSSVVNNGNGRDRMKIYRARKIYALYDELWDRPQDKPRAVRFAAKHGWAPPLAWDDDTIDDPDAVPQLGVQRTERLGMFENLLWIFDNGDGWREAVRRAGYASPHAARVAAQRAGRMDIASLIPDERNFEKESA